MTETLALPGGFAAGDFRIGGVLNRTWRVLSRNYPGVRCGYRGRKPADPLARGFRTAHRLIIAAAVVSDLMRRLSLAILVYPPSRRCAVPGRACADRCRSAGSASSP